jgi:DNA-binding MarR family transcriptional regulator
MTPPSPHAQLILDSLRRIVQALRQSSAQAERSAGLTGAQTFVLKQIRANPGLSVNDLAALTCTHQSTMSEVAGRLEARGLIVRRKSEKDGRRLELSLSSDGDAALGSGFETAQEKLLRAIAQLPEPITEHLSNGLMALIETAGLTGPPPALFLDENSASTLEQENS